MIKKSVVMVSLLVTGYTQAIQVTDDRGNVIILDKRMKSLKEDLSNYGAVQLKPGEITYVQRPLIDIEHGTLKYKINKKWATLHEVWGGEIKTTF